MHLYAVVGVLLRDGLLQRRGAHHLFAHDSVWYVNCPCSNEAAKLICFVELGEHDVKLVSISIDIALSTNCVQFFITSYALGWLHQCSI